LHFYTPLGIGSPAFWGLADVFLTVTGPTTRTWTISPGTTSIGCVIAINPN
jgi:hypothetical protein